MTEPLRYPTVIMPRHIYDSLDEADQAAVQEMVERDMVLINDYIPQEEEGVFEGLDALIGEWDCTQNYNV